MTALEAAFTIHLVLTYGGLAAGLAISLPLALISLCNRGISRLVMGMTGVLQVIPSLALVAIVVPLFGIGILPSLVVIAVSTLLPLVRNTYIGLSSPPAEDLEAARGLGLSWWETVRYVRFPPGTPAFFSGLRFAAVIANGVAVITVFIGSGGLGSIIMEGLSRFYLPQVLLGTLPAILLALVNDTALGFLERRMTPVVYQGTPGKGASTR